MSFINIDNQGRKTNSDVVAWAPKKVVATGAGDIKIKSGSGIVGNLYVATEGVSVSIKDGTEEVRPALTGVGEDDYSQLPIVVGDSITLNFSGAGTAYIIYR